jgi:hypothetical protein
MISILFIFFLAHAAPEPRSVYGTETGGEFRYLSRYGQDSFLFESKFRNELENGDYRQVMLGRYRRLTNQWRWGAFVQSEQGLRWSEDWMNKDRWGWQEGERWDTSFLIDATYRSEFLIPNLVLEWKNRLYWYPAWDALQWRFRPGLNYFVLKNDRPLWQFNAQVEYYLPLTYSQGHLAEAWYYLNALWHVNKQWKLGPMLAWRERWFNAPDEFKERFGHSWRSRQKSLYLGLSVVLAESE